jgi:hypothetical protein
MQPPNLPQGVPEHATLRAEYINCGRCPVQHGPYWYAYWREGKRMRKRYLGAPVPVTTPDAERLRLDRMLRRRIGSVERHTVETLDRAEFTKRFLGEG